MLVDSLKNKGVIFELLKIDKAVVEDDVLSRLIYLEKIKTKYPNEPFIAHEIAICYKDLEEREKYEKAVKENYEKYRGYPSVDINYVLLNFEKDGIDTLDDVFGNILNIHEVYPLHGIFDSKVVKDFYAILSDIYRVRNELLIARQCAEVVVEFDSLKGNVLKQRIDFIEKPWLKWKANFLLLAIILLILSVIGGIIWGIISLFQWIF